MNRVFVFLLAFLPVLMSAQSFISVGESSATPNGSRWDVKVKSVSPAKAFDLMTSSIHSRTNSEVKVDSTVYVIEYDEKTYTISHDGATLATFSSSSQVREYIQYTIRIKYGYKPEESKAKLAKLLEE